MQEEGQEAAQSSSYALSHQVTFGAAASEEQQSGSAPQRYVQQDSMISSQGLSDTTLVNVASVELGSKPLDEVPSERGLDAAVAPREAREMRSP